MMVKKQSNFTVAEATLIKAFKHPWYLVWDTVIFSLLSGGLDKDKKSQIAAKLVSLTDPQPAFLIGRPGLQKVAAQISEDTELVNLISLKALSLSILWGWNMTG